MPSIAFAEKRHHPFWKVDSSVATIAPPTATASGPSGTNAEYVLRLAEALRRVGLPDAHVDALETAIRQHPDPASTSDAS